MEAKQSYFLEDIEPDFPYVDEDLYYQVKDDLEEAHHMVFQLVGELYDDAENFDRDCIHEIMKRLTDTLDINLPSIDNLKL